MSEQPPWDINKPAMTAFIREDECIGCTKCIPDCPTDAIMGAAKLMHTVITDVCTGCELCVPTCPVDCIEIRPIPQRSSEELTAADALWTQRFASHNRRAEQQKQKDREQHKLDALNSVSARRDAIAEILARTKSK